MKKIFLFVITIMLSVSGIAQQSDEFLTSVYDKLHDSPMQQKFRQIAPMPFGVVFLPWAGCTEEDMRQQFRTMKKLGFTNLKQTMETPEWPEKEILRIAFEEGIIPFWYGEGGWEPITTELLKKLDIPSGTAIQEIRKNPKMVEYQNKVLWKQWEDWKISGRRSANPAITPNAGSGSRPSELELFRSWVKQHYDSIEKLTKAWNQYDVGIRSNPYKTWEDFDNDPQISALLGTRETPASSGREYGQVRDILRFRADMRIENLWRSTVTNHPEQPVRAGGEMGLFLPFASRGTDMEGIADVMTDRGSFYPSIHLAWHFEEVDFEVARCIYMQSSICVDWFKGGWAATWESTGGPQQFSGGKGGITKGSEGTAGFTVNAGTMTQLLLSYLAGGFKGVGLWSWNFREAGWESGEYGLVNRQKEPSDRAIRAGQIAKAANKYRDEIWKAHKEPYVGVFINWDNEAIWAACAGPNRTHFKYYPVQARIGISRALIDANIPWEHVTPSDLKKGLGQRYKVIYLPAHVAINEDLFPIFEEYVKQGGRLVLDAPGGWWNEHGKVLNTGKGSPFEKIFGASISDFQYSNNVPRKIGSHTLSGFILDLKPTSAGIIERFQTGEPSITENKLGKGSAVILACDASFSMKNKGNDFMERWTTGHIMKGLTVPYSCNNAIVYRLASPTADHYFFINDGDAVETSLTFSKFKYKSFTDAITGEPLTPNAIAIESNSGRWVRCEK